MITLATLPEATAQEVFDQVKNHLLTQMKTSKKEDQCLYRCGKLKCAAGALIADEEYLPQMDDLDDLGGGWARLVQNKLVPPDYSELIEDLQALHDYRTPLSWEFELRILAHKHHLNY